MLLVDSLYINNSGGFRLLMYLITELQRREVDFYLLADDRCMGQFDKCQHVNYMKASLWKRKRFYREKENCFSSVLCFGNIPAPIRLGVPVYTYFHNINLLTLSEAHNSKEKFIMWLKREVFKHYKNHTDYWLVQTDNTAAELCCHLREDNKKIRVLPFFELPASLKSVSNMQHGDDYVYISTYTGAKGHEELLEAWRLLHKRGLEKTLHLTVPDTASDFCKKLEVAKDEGVNVINHGFVPFEKVIELYSLSKAIIYPSHNESLGLGLIESIEAGCDVLASDLPFTHCICKPSVVFNPYIPEAIAEAVEKYETGNIEKSHIIISDKINELVGMII